MFQKVTQRTIGEVHQTHMQAKLSFTLPRAPSSDTFDLGEILLQPVQ
jgi:hypothetical protein